MNIEEMMDEVPAEVASSEPEVQEESPEAPPGEKGEPPAEPSEPETSEEDFSDDKPWTPERIKSAKALLQAERKKAFNMHAEASKKLKKANRDRELVLTEKKNLQAQNEVLNATMRALRTGDAKTKLQALAFLTGQPGHQVYEELSIGLATDGKNGQEKQEFSELKQELVSLREELLSRKQQDELREGQAFIETRKQEILSRVKSGKDWPLVAKFAAEDPGDVADKVVEIMMRHYEETQTPLDDTEALSMLEANLNVFVQRFGAAPPPGGDPGPGTGGQGQSPGELAQRPLGKTLNPGLAAQNGGSSRALTESEQRDLLIRELDQAGVFKQFGL